MSTNTEILDLQRKIASLSELESEALAEGDESMAAVWHTRKLRAEACLDAVNKKRGEKYAKTI